MAIAPADVKNRFPEFASLTDARIQLFIDDAELELDEGRWGDLYDKGLSYLTAHLLTLGEATSAGSGGGATLPLTSKKVGDVSLGFAAPSSTGSTESYFNSTSYGQEYYRLLIMVGMGAVGVTLSRISVIE